MGWGQTNNVWAPGWPFVLGYQDENFLNYAREQKWLSADTTIINPYIMTHMTMLNIRTTLEPWPALKIDLGFTRNYSENNSWYNVASSVNQRQTTGNFSISTISIATAFENPTTGNDFASKAFDNFLQARTTIARRQAKARAALGQENYDPNRMIDGYPDGFGSLSQEVLIPAFLAAYTGQSPEKVTLSNFPLFPLPSWQLTYNWQPKMKAQQQGIISSLTFMSKYSSMYSINSYTYNQAYTLSDIVDGRNMLGDFIPLNDIMLASIREELTPIYVDVGWMNNLSTRFEWARNRTLSLSLSNNQIMENRRTTYIIGAGYTFREIPLIFRFAAGNSRNVKTTLRVRADLSVQDEMTILRKIVLEDDAIPQVSSGQYNISIKLSADYTVSSNLTIRLFFDRMVNNPYVSSIATANTNAGLSINLSL
jgi:cell surface protein SprA